MRILTFILFLSLVACKQNTTTVETKGTNPAVETLFDEVMDLHDAIMPELSTIHDIKAKLTELKTDDNSLEVGETIRILDEADEAMMSWMAMFDMPKDESKQLEYLKGEKEKVHEVVELMKNAITKGIDYLDSLSQE